MEFYNPEKKQKQEIVKKRKKKKNILIRKQERYLEKKCIMRFKIYNSDKFKNRLKGKTTKAT